MSAEANTERFAQWLNVAMENRGIRASINNVRTLAKVFNAGMYAQDERDQKRRDDK